MKLKTLIFTLFLAFSIGLNAQISQDASYTYSGTFTTLALSGDKFFVMDVGSSQCRIYNTNHSLWKTINLEVPSGHYLNDIQYVSENLFTTDNSLCLMYTYYLYDEVNQYYTYTTKVIKEDGTLLLNLPGCQYYFVTELQEGSTKMITYSYDYSVFPSPVTTAVYSLPGSLLTAGKVYEDPYGQATFKTFPNPASRRVSLLFPNPIQSPDAMLELRNASGQLLQQIPVQTGQSQLQLDISSYPQGMYFYQLRQQDQVSAAQKLLIQ
ncbi:MAG: T9SS type A sorting domain-containing protein [Bacteroidetes bacterium]|nr:T9SS type A sorting domain-containing protein [Bacteroidota bacterium]MBU1578448.1 T9SS type A sorting domain-containing protein [Bacteroidota bacterium]MBU2466562.1 T9SS type A sorting domain-containing protein [Bacteroidota bacterium]MBU2557502.1 T9SS type A sorting domain-containing protein [Bacteroidota bacterium]